MSRHQALSYILASKRTLNLRFIVHHEADFCAAVDSNGSLFVYRGLQEPKASHGQQAVLQPDHVSDIVGAAWVPDAGMVILTSTQMVLVKGLVSSQ